MEFNNTHKNEPISVDTRDIVCDQCGNIMTVAIEIDERLKEVFEECSCNECGNPHITDTLLKIPS